MKEKIYNFLNRGDVAFTLMILSLILFMRWGLHFATIHGK
jgi:hypothetical protein